MYSSSGIEYRSVHIYAVVSNPAVSPALIIFPASQFRGLSAFGYMRIL